MGTSATILQVDLNDHTRAHGVRVHYDGYASHVGPFLSTVVARLNSVERLMVVLEDGVEWSSLDAEQDAADGSRGLVVFEGVGRAYPENDRFAVGPGDVAELVSSEEWAYLFSANGETLGVYLSGDLTALYEVAKLSETRWDLAFPA